LTIKNSKSRDHTWSHKISGKALHHFTASQLHRKSRASLILLQHAASQQCLSKASNTSFFLSEKENIFNTKAMVTCKRSAAVVKKLTNYEHLALSKTKKASPSCFRASLALCTLLLPWKTHWIHGANWFTSIDKK